MFYYPTVLFNRSVPASVRQSSLVVKGGRERIGTVSQCDNNYYLLKSMEEHNIQTKSNSCFRPVRRIRLKYKEQGRGNQSQFEYTTG